MEIILNINDLAYEVANMTIFSVLNMHLSRNTITTISGQNNCGKTTLLKLLSSNELVEPGHVVIAGKDIIDYSKQELERDISSIFPLKTFFHEGNVKDEIFYQCQEYDTSKLNFVLDELGINNLNDKNLKSLSPKDIILLQIAIGIIKAHKIVLIDSLDNFFTKDEIFELYYFFKECIKKYDLTFLVTTTSLEEAIYTDMLYIIDEGVVLLSGEPEVVLQKDNILNKAGLKVPFMIDLSVKLRDYDLIKKIELNKERLINTLWK